MTAIRNNTVGELIIDPAIEEALGGKRDSGLMWMFVVDVAVSEDGSVCLFGKKEGDDGGEARGLCVVAEGLDEVFYAVPRKGADPRDVFSEILGRAQMAGTRIRGKVKKKNYAFGDPSIPHGTSEFVKVLAPPGTTDLGTRDGKTYSAIIPAHRSRREHAIAKIGLCGPGWVAISDKHDGGTSTSTSTTTATGVLTRCKLELHASVRSIHAEKISSRPEPRLVVASVTVAATRGSATTTPSTKRVSPFWAMRLGSIAMAVETYSVDGGTTATRLYEIGDRDAVEKTPAGVVRTVRRDEGALVERFFSDFETIDPDLVVGADVHDFTYPMLIKTAKESGAEDSWQMLGKFRRRSTHHPNRRGATGTWRMARSSAHSLRGRPICDVVAMAKQQALGVSRRTYDLGGLCGRGTCIEDGTVEAAVALLDLCRRLSGFSLPREMASVSGLPWSDACHMSMSEHVEALLVREFGDRSFVCPPPFQQQQQQSRGGSAPTKRGRDEISGSVTEERDHRAPQYEGGKVLSVVPGLYDGFVVVMDFKSQYPSIIAEHNVCFTTTHVEKNSKGNLDTVCDVDETAVGVLPRIVTRLVKWRRRVVAERDAIGGREDAKRLRDRLETRQLALKRMVNSIYGCLAFRRFRFYTPGIAALVARLGREALGRLVDATKTRGGMHIVYGDTDSVMPMIEGARTREEAVAAAEEVAAVVNADRKYVRVEIAEVYDTMLIVSKKRYVVWPVDRTAGESRPPRVVKGLEMVRRDWCALVSEACSVVLSAVEGGKRGAELARLVEERVRTWRETMASPSHDRPIVDFAVANELSGDDIYGDEGTWNRSNTPLPTHTAVARRLVDTGRRIPSGRVVAYVHDSATGSANRVVPLADARHPDVEYYLRNQVYPPLNRLVGAIGLDKWKIDLHAALGMATPRPIAGSFATRRSEPSRRDTATTTTTRTVRRRPDTSVPCATCGVSTVPSVADVLRCGICDQSYSRIAVDAFFDAEIAWTMSTRRHSLHRTTCRSFACTFSGLYARMVGKPRDTGDVCPVHGGGDNLTDSVVCAERCVQLAMLRSTVERRDGEDDAVAWTRRELWTRVLDAERSLSEECWIERSRY